MNKRKMKLNFETPEKKYGNDRYNQSVNDQKDETSETNRYKQQSSLSQIYKNELPQGSTDEYLPYINGNVNNYSKHHERHKKVEEIKTNSLNSSFVLGKQYNQTLRKNYSSLYFAGNKKSQLQGSPSCTNIDSKYRNHNLPLSTLSVTKYRFLLTEDDREKDTLHLPIDYCNKNFKSEGFESSPLKKSDIRDTAFQGFNTIKTHNKNLFHEMKQNDEKLQNINFELQKKDLGQYTQNFKAPQMQMQRSLTHNTSIQKGFMKVNPKLTQYDKFPIQIQTELVHNKGIMQKLERLDQQDLKKTQARLINKQQRKLKKVENASNYRILSTIEAQERQFKLGQDHILSDGTKSTISQKLKKERELEEKLKKQSYMQKKRQTMLEQQPQNNFNPQRIYGIKNDKLEILWYNFEQNWWKPAPREQMTMVNYGGIGFMFGGIGTGIYNEVQYLSMGNYQWLKTKTKGHPPCPRLGHTMNLYDKQLIVFGGEKEYNTQMKKRDCLLDVHSFNLQTRTWTPIQCSHIYLQMRRNHIAEVIGKQLVIHGGLNYIDKVLNDIWILDLQTFGWLEAKTIDEPLYAAFHSSCSVFYSGRRNHLQVYKNMEYKPSKFAPHIQEEGIYTFGGKDETGKLHNKLRILDIQQKKLKWVEPLVYGVAPSARMGHSMVFHEKYHFVIVYGGLYEDEMRQEYLSDLFILDVQSLTWVNVTYLTQAPRPSGFHSCCLHETKLIIFGGINENGFQSDVRVAELDCHLGRKIEQNEILKKELPGENQLKNLSKYEGQLVSEVNSQPVEEDQNQVRIEEKEQELKKQQLLYSSLRTYQPLPTNNSIRRKSSIMATVLLSKVLQKARSIKGVEEYKSGENEKNDDGGIENL